MCVLPHLESHPPASKMWLTFLVSELRQQTSLFFFGLNSFPGWSPTAIQGELGVGDTDMLSVYKTPHKTTTKSSQSMQYLRMIMHATCLQCQNTQPRVSRKSWIRNNSPPTNYVTRLSNLHIALQILHVIKEFESKHTAVFIVLLLLH